MKGAERKYTKEIKGVDCGKHTWVDILSNHNKTAGPGKHEQSLAGRISYELIELPGYIHLYHRGIRIGPYDDQIMPALMLFKDKKKSCTNMASRHFYNPRDPYPGEFQGEDFISARTLYASDSLMLRPGYRVYLYEQKMWHGKYAVYEGKWASGDASEGKLEC